MRILLTNDDGVHARGLEVLERLARTLSDDITIVAPLEEQSGKGRSLSLTEPVRLRKFGERRFAVTGTPTDCVMMAMHEIFKDKKPDLLLSGINRGANLGEDVTYSGTVAVAMEGSLLGVPSIAMSQCFQHGHPVKWGTAEHHAPKVIKKLIKSGWPKGTLININFPDVTADKVTGVEVVPQGQRDLTDLLLDARVDARGVPYYWVGFRRQKSKAKRHTDLGATENGAISVTPLQLDLTHDASMKALKTALR